MCFLCFITVSCFLNARRTSFSNSVSCINFLWTWCFVKFGFPCFCFFLQRFQYCQQGLFLFFYYVILTGQFGSIATATHPSCLFQNPQLTQSEGPLFFKEKNNTFHQINHETQRKKNTKHKIIVHLNTIWSNALDFSPSHVCVRTHCLTHCLNGRVFVGRATHTSSPFTCCSGPGPGPGPVDPSWNTEILQRQRPICRLFPSPVGLGQFPSGKLLI